MTWILRTPKTTATAARSARSSPGACSTVSNGSASGWPVSRPSAAPMLPHGCAPTAASSGRPGTVEPKATGDDVVLVLPYPISANRYWNAITIPGRTMMAPSKEAIAYRKQVAAIAQAARIAQPFTWRVAVELDLYPHRPQDWARRARRDPEAWDDDVRCIDLGNAEKVLSDALQGIVFTDDRWIWDLHKRRKEPDGEGRVVLRIRPMARLRAQAELIA